MESASIRNSITLRYNINCLSKNVRDLGNWSILVAKVYVSCEYKLNTIDTLIYVIWTVSEPGSESSSVSNRNTLVTFAAAVAAAGDDDFRRSWCASARRGGAAGAPCSSARWGFRRPAALPAVPLRPRARRWPGARLAAGGVPGDGIKNYWVREITQTD